MPDVEFRWREDTPFFMQLVTLRDQLVFQDKLAVVVAKVMDCLDHRTKKMIVHDPQTQISFPTFSPIDGRSDTLVIMIIEAFDWPDRMSDLWDRLEVIRKFVEGYFDLPPNSAAVSFRKLSWKDRAWTRG